MKVPPKRKGNFALVGIFLHDVFASMKVPPKRKGNASAAAMTDAATINLNESPSEKEGKSLAVSAASFKLIPPQ